MFNESTYPFNFMTTGDGVDSDLVIPDSFGQCLSYEQQIAFILKLIEDIDTGVVVPDITADATVDQSTGTPSVTVVKTGTDEEPVFTFNFHNIKGETGQRGEQGETGEQGEQGRPGNDGADGISPTVTTTQITDGYRITITDALGDHTFDIYNGVNGTDGQQGPAGYSPTVTITSITGGHSVTITDEDGDHTFNVLDGVNGTDGTDGVSPSISVTSITGGHQVSITDAQGTDTFNVMDGVDGTDGSDGSDGVSPVITSTPITGGHRITIVDAQGTTDVDVMDGATGQTGATGNGIASTVLNQDYTLTITYTDGTTYTTPSIRGAQGVAGQNGTDGISPTVTVTDYTTYHHIVITSAGGTEQFDVYDGADGISPTVTVRDITGGHQIEIVSAGGTERFDVMDGTSGSQGPTGPAGPGVAAGGTLNQMLVKSSSADYATKWVRNPMNPIAELILEDRNSFIPFCKLTFYQYPSNSNGMFVNIKQCGLVLEPDNLNTFNMNVTQRDTSTRVGLDMTGLSNLEFNSILTAIIKQCAIFNQSIFSQDTTVHYEFSMYFSNTTRSGNEYLSSIPSLVQNYIGGTSITVTDEFQESSLFMLAKANSITVDGWLYYYYTTTLYTGKITTFSYSNISGVLTTEVALSKQNITVGTNDILIPVEGYNVYIAP